MEDMIDHPVNREGLRRLVTLELSRLVPGTREEAQRVMRGKVGPYDHDGTVIEAGINCYFASRAICN